MFSHYLNTSRTKWAIHDTETTKIVMCEASRDSVWNAVLKLYSDEPVARTLAMLSLCRAKNISFSPSKEHIIETLHAFWESDHHDIRFKEFLCAIARIKKMYLP